MRQIIIYNIFSSKTTTFYTRFENHLFENVMINESAVLYTNQDRSIIKTIDHIYLLHLKELISN